MTDETDPWLGDWRARILRRIRVDGAKTLTEWAERSPIATFPELAAILGWQVAPIQIENLLKEEAVQHGDLDSFARSCLVRYLRQRVPKGWRSGDRANFEKARAFGSWLAALGPEWQHQADLIWSTLQKDGVAPIGWLPAGSHDPIIEQLFQGVRFVRKS